MGLELEDGPDTEIIARQVVEAKKTAGKAVPSHLDLAEAITDIRIEDTIKGSSTLTLKVVDPEWNLMDSGFFDVNTKADGKKKDGKLDPVDVEYPEDSNLHWRLQQIGIQGGGQELLLLGRDDVGGVEACMEEDSASVDRRGKVLVVPPPEESCPGLAASQLIQPVLAVVRRDARRRHEPLFSRGTS